MKNDLIEKRTLPQGTVVTFKGLPFWLVDATEIEGALGNFQSLESDGMLFTPEAKPPA